MDNETATSVCENNSIIPINGAPIVFYTEQGSLTGGSSIIYKSMRQSPRVLFSEDESIVSDFQVLRTDAGDLVAIWKQVAMALPDKHRIFYGRIDNSLNLIKKYEITTTPSNIKIHTLKGVISGNFLVISAYDTSNEKFIVITHNYQTDKSPDTIDYFPDTPSSEFRDSRHSLFTNIQLLTNGENILLQANVENQVLRTWQLNIDDSGVLTSSVLFDFADSNLGFHRTIIDESGDFMLIVFSGLNTNTTKYNDIYIVKQPLFPDNRNYKPQVVSINQTHGYYVRPEIICKDNVYWLLWEGNRIYYTAINSDLLITVPEGTIEANKPGSILISNTSELIISNTSNKLPLSNSGLGIEMHVIPS